MKKIIRAVGELKRVLIRIKMYECLMDALICFLILFFICQLFLIPWWISLFPTFAYLLYNTRKKFDSVKLIQVEKAVPELREQLRTSADNIYKENEIVDSLHNDVLYLMKKVKISYFIPFKKIWREMVVLAVLCFAVILVSSLNVKLVDYKVVLDELGNVGEFEDGRYDWSLQVVAGRGNDTDIFGNESLAELGQEQLNLQINPALSEINIDDIRDVEDRDFTETMFPSEIIASTDRSFDDDIPKENKEIVKRYFSKIAQVK